MCRWNVNFYLFISISNEQDLPDVKTLLDVCTNFLIINDNDEVRLVHYTVQEYLLENSIVPARQDLALELTILCTVYLSLDVFRNEPDSLTIYGSPEEQLMHYMRKYFYRHLTACKDDKRLLMEPLLRLLGSGCEGAANLISYRTPSLFIAVKLGKAEVVRGLLKTPKYASLINGRHKGTPLLTYAIDYNDMSIIQLLLENGADTSARSQLEGTALHSAVSRGSVEIVQLLLDNGADISASDEEGNTTLHLAVLNESVEVSQLLLDNGADISAINGWGSTALHLAVLNQSMEVSLLLLNNGANISAGNEEGDTALHLAVLNGSAEITQLLLDNGADISVVNKRGDTVLHLAVDMEDVEKIRLLLENGADVSTRNKAGTLEIIQLLLEKVTGITAQNDEKTTIHLAILEKIGEIAQTPCSHEGVPGISRETREPFGFNTYGLEDVLGISGSFYLYGGVYSILD
ncbi:uncharacterized protein LAJ45_04383 [Morchella importuna]|uniref:uncharacterized protein n=1 Tax=Morchella importuna TaxID=1174673 RepID=UPI001E8EADDA|nr:uncharacterized protein LAJ45_04383 [Morchella importuna]KAH8151761.1 hypothetical protein LAJ45_04383 [Morchella importuna]